MPVKINEFERAFRTLLQEASNANQIDAVISIVESELSEYKSDAVRDLLSSLSSVSPKRVMSYKPVRKLTESEQKSIEDQIKWVVVGRVQLTFKELAEEVIADLPWIAEECGDANATIKTYAMKMEKAGRIQFAHGLSKAGNPVNDTLIVDGGISIPMLLQQGDLVGANHAYTSPDSKNGS